MHTHHLHSQCKPCVTRWWEASAQVTSKSAEPVAVLLAQHFWCGFFWMDPSHDAMRLGSSQSRLVRPETAAAQNLSRPVQPHLVPSPHDPNGKAIPVPGVLPVQTSELRRDAAVACNSQKENWEAVDAKRFQKVEESRNFLFFHSVCGILWLRMFER